MEVEEIEFGGAGRIPGIISRSPPPARPARHFADATFARRHPDRLIYPSRIARSGRPKQVSGGDVPGCSAVSCVPLISLHRRCGPGRGIPCFSRFWEMGSMTPSGRPGATQGAAIVTRAPVGGENLDSSRRSAFHVHELAKTIRRPGVLEQAFSRGGGLIEPRRLGARLPRNERRAGLARADYRAADHAVA